MKRKSKYQPYLNKVDRELEKARLRMEKYIKPIIKTEALKLKVDMCNTQHSFSVGNIHNTLFEDNSKLDIFQDFIYTLSDVHRIDVRFEVLNGKFNWY